MATNGRHKRPSVHQRTREAPRQQEAPTQQQSPTEWRIARAARSDGEKEYAAPAGFPADPEAWLAYMAEGQFTPEQERYLRSNAYGMYVNAINSARGNEELREEVALGDRIIAVWTAWLQEHPAPKTNPFGG